jgi:hypothetical protein
MWVLHIQKWICKRNVQENNVFCSLYWYFFPRSAILVSLICRCNPSLSLSGLLMGMHVHLWATLVDDDRWGWRWLSWRMVCVWLESHPTRGSEECKFAQEIDRSPAGHHPGQQNLQKSESVLFTYSWHHTSHLHMPDPSP